MNDGNRISTLESESRRVQADIEKIWQNIDRRNQNHTEIMSTLAVIISKQDDFKSYQVRCDADREAYSDRINSLENTNKTNKSVVAAIASVVSIAWAGVTFLFSK